MSILIQNIKQQCVQFTKIFLLIKESSIVEILLAWKVKLHNELEKLERNPAGYLEPAFYSQLNFQSKIAAAPFRLDLVSSSACNNQVEDGEVRPRVVPRSGLGLFLTILLQTLLMSRNVLFISTAFTTEQLVVVKKGRFTRDGLLYFVHTWAALPHMGEGHFWREGRKFRLKRGMREGK